MGHAKRIHKRSKRQKIMLNIKTYKTGDRSTFYIQCKGLHSGRPLKSPITNCFSVHTDVQNAYEIVYALYKSGTFKWYILGSVVPFIRITDLKKIVVPALRDRTYDQKSLLAIRSIDKKVELMEQQIILLKESQASLAVRVLSEKKFK